MAAVGAGSIITASAQLQAGREAEAQGYSQQNIQNYNAATLINNALSEKGAALFNQQHQAEQGARQVGTIRASAGVSGARMDSNAIVAAVAEQSQNNELDNLLMGYESLVKQRQMQTQAEQAKRYGASLAAAGVSAKKASYWQATATVLQGFGGAASAWPSKSGTGNVGGNGMSLSKKDSSDMSTFGMGF